MPRRLAGGCRDVFMSAAVFPFTFLNKGSKPRMQAPASSLRHNLANHGNLPDLDDVQELLVYLTLLFIVLSWMLREIHIAFFTTGHFAAPLACVVVCFLCSVCATRALMKKLVRDQFLQITRAIQEVLQRAEKCAAQHRLALCADTSTESQLGCFVMRGSCGNDSGLRVHIWAVPRFPDAGAGEVSSLPVFFFRACFAKLLWRCISTKDAIMQAGAQPRTLGGVYSKLL